MRLQDQVSLRLMIVPNKLSLESGRIKDSEWSDGKIYIQSFTNGVLLKTKCIQLAITQRTSNTPLLYKRMEDNHCKRLSKTTLWQISEIWRVAISFEFDNFGGFYTVLFHNIYIDAA